jgi:predicted dehydrogenase
MRTPVSVGIVGLGQWGPVVARTFEQLSGTELRWICDRGAEAHLRHRSRFADARWTADFDRLLADDTVDAIVIATPPSAHYEIARRALEANKHVFVQGPLTMSSAEAWELVEDAERRRRVLMAADGVMLNPAFLKLKSLVQQGALGDVYYAYANWQTLGGLRRDEDPLWSFGAYGVAALLSLFDDQPVEVAARGEAYVRENIPDVVFCYLKFATGISAHLHLSCLDPRELRRLTVVGGRSMAVIDDLALEGRLTLYDKAIASGEGDEEGESLQVRLGDIVSPHVPSDDPLRLESAHFVSAIRSQFALQTGAREAAVVVEILESLQRSLENGGAAEPFIARTAAPADATVVALGLPRKS